MNIHVYYDDNRPWYRGALAKLSRAYLPTVDKPSSAIDFKLDLLTFMARTPDVSTDTGQIGQRLWPKIVSHAHPYIWTEEMARTSLAAAAGLADPGLISLSALPLHPMIWMYERPPILQVEGQGESLLVAETVEWLETDDRRGI